MISMYIFAVVSAAALAVKRWAGYVRPAYAARPGDAFLRGVAISTAAPPRRSSAIHFPLPGPPGSTTAKKWAAGGNSLNRRLQPSENRLHKTSVGFNFFVRGMILPGRQCGAAADLPGLPRPAAAGESLGSAHPAGQGHIFTEAASGSK